MLYGIPCRGRIPTALTIAGSDSGGGAGIEADLKTFAALGVHGLVALTSITAQNTYSVTKVQDVDLDVIEAQIRAVAEDLGIDAAKTGMLHTSEIISRVAKVLNEYSFPLVIDPVMIAKSGAELLKPEAVDTLKSKLLPRAYVVTPNIPEAEKLSNLKIKSLDDAIKAAEEISRYGVEAVVVKGGHLEAEYAIDVLYYKGRVWKFKAVKYNVTTTHGTGCSFSAAIAAGLAKGFDLVKAVETAKKLVEDAIRFGLNIGRGAGPVNPLAGLYRDASKYRILIELEEFLDRISKLEGIERLIPEVGMNIAYVADYPRDKNDIAAVPGRIRRLPTGGIAYLPPRFGVSDHLSRYLLKIREYDPLIKTAINIRFDERILDILKGLNLKISFYDRREEPEEIKRVEGATVQWGVEYAIRKAGGIVPDVIYHRGDIGKEPMIVIFGDNLDRLYEVIKRILLDLKG